MSLTLALALPVTRCETQPAERQAVTAFPEIRAFERHADDEFVVLACDGIWDVMSSQQVVSKVSDWLQNGRPPPPPPPADEDAADPPAEPRPPPRPWDMGAVCEASPNAPETNPNPNQP